MPEPLTQIQDDTFEYTHLKSIFIIFSPIYPSILPPIHLPIGMHTIPWASKYFLGMEKSHLNAKRVVRVELWREKKASPPEST